MSEVLQGDCLELMKTMDDNSVDAIVTDPPYGLSFMGKKWDYDVPSQEIWEECLRVLKPGGYLLSFAGTRTQHRMAVRIEDAGFEIRDMIAWVYGSGFPKSLNIGKAIDKIQGNEREEYDKIFPDGSRERKTAYNFGHNKRNTIHDKGTSEGEGWGTALKPAFEPVTIARKPVEGSVAENFLKWGTGGINIDECRIKMDNSTDPNIRLNAYNHKGHGSTFTVGGDNNRSLNDLPDNGLHNSEGRFPANFIHDGSEEVLEQFPHTISGKVKNDKESYEGESATGFLRGETNQDNQYGDSGSAARFFYCAKASVKEREIGCEDLNKKSTIYMARANGTGEVQPGIENFVGAPRSNFHPTVKPVALMEYLVKLVSKEGATVLDPFGGSGSTALACQNLNRNYIIMEREEEYVKIIEHRLKDNLIDHSRTDNRNKEQSQVPKKKLKKKQLF